MSGEEFIILPNGNKLYLKDTYGMVKRDDMPKHSVIREIFDEMIGRDRINPKGVAKLFDGIKEYAFKDGNNELSDEELELYIQEKYPEVFRQDVKAKDLLKFFGIVQKASDNSLKKSPEGVKAENSILKFMPEVVFLNLGLDDNIDTKALTFDEIFEQHYKNGNYRTEEWNDGENTFKRIVENNTNQVLVEEKISSDGSSTMNLLTEDNRQVEISHNYFEEDKLDYFRITNGDVNIHIQNNEVASIYDMNKSIVYEYNSGILSTIGDNNTRKFYTIENNKVVQTKDMPSFEPPRTHEDISDNFLAILSADEINLEELTNIIQNSVKNKSIGQDMDDYFAKTGRELIDDIQNTNIPQKLKKDLLNQMCEPFVDSKEYDAHKKIENSQVSNKYYQSKDIYDIQYNGPIITLFNQTTGETRRINMKTKMSDFEFISKGRRKRSMKELQNFPGEMLENIDIEIKAFKSLTRENRHDEYTKFAIGGFYLYDEITAPKLKARLIAHETAHGIDNLADYSYASAFGKFKETFDKCMERYEASGHKRFNDQKTYGGNNVFKALVQGDNYATYNEKEAFAVCMGILLGVDKGDYSAKHVKKYLPELIDATRELYLAIRELPEEDRRNPNN